MKSSDQLSKYDWINTQANKEVSTLQNHPAGRIQPRNGRVLVRGPYV